MIRTQIQVTQEQAKSLKRLARERRCSVAELIRRGIQLVLGTQGALPSELKERAASISGKYRSGKSDISRAHDKYLADAYRR